jgi:hypothetical protein
MKKSDASDPTDFIKFDKNQPKLVLDAKATVKFVKPVADNLAELTDKSSAREEIRSSCVMGHVDPFSHIFFKI